MRHVIHLYVTAPEIILAEPMQMQQTLQSRKPFVDIFWFRPVALWALNLTPQMEKFSNPFNLFYVYIRERPHRK